MNLCIFNKYTDINNLSRKELLSLILNLEVKQ